MENNEYLERYRRQSTILNGYQNASSMNQPLIPGNPSNLNSHLLQLLGGDQNSKNPRHYLAPENKWVQGRIPYLREELVQLEKKWEQHCLSELKIGNVKPREWPDDLRDKKLKAEARLEISLEEQQELQRLIDQAEQDKKAREKKPTNSRLSGAGRLSNGVLVEFCDWNVSMNSEGILAIDDTSSPFNTMEIWRLKAEVLNVISQENVLRHKTEEQQALKEGRSRRKVPYPQTPIWNRNNDLIEYIGIDNSIIRKLKREN